MTEAAIWEAAEKALKGGESWFRLTGPWTIDVELMATNQVGLRVYQTLGDEQTTYTFDATEPLNLISRLFEGAITAIAREWASGPIRFPHLLLLPWGSNAMKVVLAVVHERLGPWRLSRVGMEVEVGVPHE